jgi:hypothetical protein
LDVTTRLHGNHTFLLPLLLETDNIRFEFSGDFFRRISHVKRTNILTALLVGLALITTGCGTSDYVQSVQLSATGANSGGFFNLVGIDGTLQLTATAIYHSGKNVPVTSSVTYTVTPIGCEAGTPLNPCAGPLPAYGPTTVPIDSTGMMTAVASLCTWEDIGNPVPTPPTYNWVYTGYYQVVATYQGMASQPIAVGVGSQAGNTAPNGACGPS